MSVPETARQDGWPYADRIRLTGRLSLLATENAAGARGHPGSAPMGWEHFFRGRSGAVDAVADIDPRSTEADQN